MTSQVEVEVVHYCQYDFLKTTRPDKDQANSFHSASISNSKLMVAEVPVTF